MIVPGRCRGGRIQILANALILIALFVGTHALASGSADLTVGAWSVPWSGDIVLVSAGLLFLGLAFLLPLHGGLLNLGIHAQFLVGFAVGAAISRGESHTRMENFRAPNISTVPTPLRRLSASRM